MTPMIKRNCICIKTAEYVLLIHKTFKVIQQMVYFLHLFQKGLLLAKAVNNSRLCSKVSFFRSNSKNQAIGVSIWNFAWSVISPKGMEAQLCLTVRWKSEISGHPRLAVEQWLTRECGIDLKFCAKDVLFGVVEKDNFINSVICYARLYIIKCKIQDKQIAIEGFLNLIENEGVLYPI